MTRLETALVGLFSLAWVVALGALIGVLPLAGQLDLDLHRYFSVAAVGGWLAGNVYVNRLDGPAAAFRRRLLLVYLVGPPSFLYLLRGLASESAQRTAPLVPLYAFVVFGLFFLVPWTLRATRRQRP